MYETLKGIRNSSLSTATLYKTQNNATRTNNTIHTTATLYSSCLIVGHWLSFARLSGQLRTANAKTPKIKKEIENFIENLPYKNIEYKSTQLKSQGESAYK